MLPSAVTMVIHRYARSSYQPTIEIKMQKKLSAIGNSLGLIIERPILELLRIDKDTTIELSTDGESLTLRPIRPTRAERVRAASQRVADEHSDAFEKLAR
jgi:antitoxin component of MazEF toxin-antitoxin module